MEAETHRKNAEARDNFFVTPSFAQVMHVLALGFGLAGDRQKKLSDARSFGGKQERYSRYLLPKLLSMLAVGNLAIARDLKWRLGQMEYLLSHVRSSYLFTHISPMRGLNVFLLVWAYPHLAALLGDLRSKVSQASPLYYLPEMVPRRNDAADDILKIIKRSVRAALGDDVEAPNFLQALDRLERDSSKKLSTIEEEVGALNDEIRFQLRDDGAREWRVASVRAAYIAGVAVKRFLDMLASIERLPLQALGACLDDAFDSKEDGPTGLLSLHKALYRRMGNPIQLLNDDSSILEYLQDAYRQWLDAVEPDTIQSGTNLVMLFESRPLRVQAVEVNLKHFFEHPKSSLFEAFGLLFSARLALYKGDLTISLGNFKRILEYAESQQLGEIAHQAAGCAIALEVMTREQVQYGSLEPLVLHRAQFQPQTLEIRLPLPTPFSSFGGIRKLPIAIQQIFEAIADFNLRQAYMPSYPDRPLCNPLARLDRLLADFFSELEQQRKIQAQPQKAVRKSVTSTFGRRARSVLSIHTATPYQALRDVWSYMSFFFGNKLMFHEQLNVNIHRYMSLSSVMQRRILKALDPVAYRHDINVAKRLKRRARYIRRT